MPKRNRATAAVRQRATDELAQAFDALRAAHMGTIAAWHDGVADPTEVQALFVTVEHRLSRAVDQAARALAMEPSA